MYASLMNLGRNWKWLMRQTETSKLPQESIFGNFKDICGCVTKVAFEFSWILACVRLYKIALNLGSISELVTHNCWFQEEALFIFLTSHVSNIFETWDGQVHTTAASSLSYVLRLTKWETDPQFLFRKSWTMVLCCNRELYATRSENDFKKFHSCSRSGSHTIRDYNKAPWFPE